MDENRSIEILKTALLLEHRGKAFYSKVAEQTTDPDVKQVFEIMADEEVEHIKFLTEQYSHYVKNKTFKEMKLPKDHSDTASTILTNKIKENISGASYEAAAIASAIELENSAIAVYSDRADQATDPEEKTFYNWLANWEKGHHKLLFELNAELKEKIWQDNSFWPT